MNDDERLALALAQLDRTQAFHGRIETRSAGLLALNLAMASIIVLNFTHELTQTHWVCVGAAAILLNLAAAAFVISISFSHLKNKAQPSLLYFGDISKHFADDYIRKMKTASVPDLLSDALCQVWRNSEILSMKFARLQWAFILTCAAIVPWLIFLAADVFVTGSLPMLSK